MKLRWKHLLGLGAAAVAIASLTPVAVASGFNNPVTNTYSAQTVALNNGNVAIPSAFIGPGGPLRYQTASGQYAGTAAGAAGDVITFTALTPGATFVGAPTVVC